MTDQLIEQLKTLFNMIKINHELIERQQREIESLKETIKTLKQ